MNHTPGPWQIKNRIETGKHAEVWFKEECIAENVCPVNAKLISAAPELLTCCEASLTYLMLDRYLDKEQLIVELKRTLAKARGENIDPVTFGKML